MMISRKYILSLEILLKLIKRDMQTERNIAFKKGEYERVRQQMDQARGNMKLIFLRAVLRNRSDPGPIFGQPVGSTC